MEGLCARYAIPIPRPRSSSYIPARQPACLSLLLVRREFTLGCPDGWWLALPTSLNSAGGEHGCLSSASSPSRRDAHRPRARDLMRLG